MNMNQRERASERAVGVWVFIVSGQLSEVERFCRQNQSRGCEMQCREWHDREMKWEEKREQKNIENTQQTHRHPIIK